MDQQTSVQIRNLEKRIHWLTAIVIVLAILLTPIAGLIPLAIIGFLAVLPILAFTHKWLPGIARHCGRMVSFCLRLLRHGHPTQG